MDFGTFSIPIEYYNIFKILGSFINGQDSIMFKWAEFSVQTSKNNLSIDKVINKVLEGPITTRNIAESKRLYKNILQREGQVYCVWSGRKISNYDIDHLIPFSVLKNMIYGIYSHQIQKLIIKKVIKYHLQYLLKDKKI